ncbi:DUF2759 family protein [Cerasibacillus terrae]|uniref:DUF2759 family protein n=1 Tax=Cerasibacillus terrae TaxID=2498845 RepID=A0A5C8P4B0_9BACI|nr:DUF2759 family protein [Cerasibacillus terrae]TXL67973.1 DUF2759 family protein [Cerasibacillus terrae]
MNHLVLAIIFLVVAVVSLIGLFRSFKFKNGLAIVFAGLSTLTFGFFSIATIINVLKEAM